MRYNKLAKILTVFEFGLVFFLFCYLVKDQKLYLSLNILQILVANPDLVTWSHGYFGYVPPLAVP